ncbi:hypothetical protein NQ315_012633 [Exocentrus adspersus]|uniref:CHK kinase-like domain-containing protein n=1 Tax=Exocentrus adspersus TaxID=1586481 RepID=A0AAV8VTT5_9CUCU|nr:hypothetical protein NQ315_012633 [Exocentrus adspersus]
MVKSKVSDLHGLLSKTLGKGIQVLDEETTLLTAPGEHYGSIMLALKVKIKNPELDGGEEVLHLAAKLIPANEMLRKAFDIYVTFKKEVYAYTRSIPALVQLQLEYNVPRERIIDIFPKCYGARLSLDDNFSEVDEDAVILFENLKVQGYKTEDRLVGFDLEGARIVVRDLAKFHALPIALKLLKPQVFKEQILPSLVQNKGLEQLPAEVGKAFHDSIMEGCKEIKQLEQYLDRVQKVVDYAAEHPFVLRPPPNEPWGTMSHSDYWTSNTMLLKDKDGKPLKNKMVDLQLMTYNSALRDLVFFLFTSVMNEVLEKHYEEFIKLYHESFLENLKDFDLDLEAFSWDNFQKELSEIGPSEVYHVLVMLKPICTERGKVQNSLEDFQDTDWSRKDLLGPNHRRKLRDTVLAFVKRNWM